MKRRRVLASLAGVAVSGGCLGATRSLSSSDGGSSLEYERGTVTIVGDGGSTLATVEVRIADTDRKRYTGLSNTESLDAGEGMLFIHEEVDQQAYVMRDMAFPLDIVFIDADGTITEIHHAPLPPEGGSEDLKRYRGRGKYVLEVPKGYTTEQNISVGDCVRISRESETTTTAQSETGA